MLADATTDKPVIYMFVVVNFDALALILADWMPAENNWAVKD